MIYEPAEDSFLIANCIKKYCKNKKVLDIGTGSGILAETALENNAKEVVALDINKEAVRLLRKKGINAIKSDLFENVKEKFDLIVFNPPYLPKDNMEDAESALATAGGRKGDEILIRFFSGVGRYLNNNGIILFLISSFTPRKKIIETIRKNGLKKVKIGEKKLFMERLEVWKVKRQSLKA